MTALLSKDQITQIRALPTEDVEVPEWGGTVRVRSLSAGERDDFEAAVVRTKGKDVQVNRKNLRARLVAMCLVGDDGKTRLLSDEDVVPLSYQSAAAVERVFAVAQRLSGLAPADVEQLAGN